MMLENITTVFTPEAATTASSGSDPRRFSREAGPSAYCVVDS